CRIADRELGTADGFEVSRLELKDHAGPSVRISAVTASTSSFTKQFELSRCLRSCRTSKHGVCMTALVSVPTSRTEEDYEARDRSAAKASERAEETWQVKRAIERDANAFAELYDRHVVRVYRHIYYVVNDRNAAE